MIKDLRQTLEYLKNLIENTARASVKAIIQSTFKVKVENDNFDVNVKNMPETFTVKGSVDVENMADYTEVFMDLERSIGALKPLLKALDKDPKVSVSNLKDIKFPSKIEISNPQKKIEITNFDAIYKELKNISKALNQLPTDYPKFPDFPKFPEIKFPDTKAPVVNVPAFPKEITVKDLQKLIKLAEKLTAGKPKDPIAVRLSNGKEFYEALTEVYTTGGGGQVPFTYYAGGRESALISNKREQVVVSSERFVNNDVDDVSESLTYIGQENSDGDWQIMRVTESSTVTSFRYATIKNNSTKKTYTGAWNARASLSYGKVSEALS